MKICPKCGYKSKYGSSEKYVTSDLAVGSRRLFTWPTLQNGDLDSITIKNMNMAIRTAAKRRGWLVCLEGSPAGLSVTRIK